MASVDELTALANEARQCRRCERELPLGPNPIFAVHPDARILVASQAPGRLAHESGVPFDDPSGRRLREWMGIDADTFYRPENVAIVPMGFCYPGKNAGGDLPPIDHCAGSWRQRFLDQLTQLKLTLLIGHHAQKWHLDRPLKSVRETVARWSDVPPGTVALPHPSPRNNAWLRDNPWFEAEILPRLKARVAAALA